MLKRVLLVPIVLALFCAVGAAQEPLARSLPAEDTVVYAEVDLGKALAVAEDTAKFIDRESGEKVAYQVKNLYSLGRKLAKKHNFQPALMDSIDQSIIYFVLAEGEQQPYVPALVVEARDKAATADFMSEVKGLLKRQQQRQPDAPQWKWQEAQVDRGEAITMGPGGMVGRLDQYLVVSTDVPRRLWAALGSSAGNPLSNTPMYRRLRQGENTHWTAMVNINPLVDRLQGYVENNLKQAQEKANQQSGDQNMQARSALQSAQSMKKALDIATEVFSLNKIQMAGMSANVSMGQDAISSDSMMLVSHDGPLSPAMKEIFGGSGDFALPETGDTDAVAFACRVNVAEVYSNIMSAVKNVDPSWEAMARGMMQMMKGRIGMSPDDFMNMIASDFYVFGGVARKEMPSMQMQPPSGPNEKPQMKMEMKMTVVPDITLLWGVKDPQSARGKLSDLFTMLAGQPNMSRYVNKRTYQETDVFCLGQGVSKSEGYPNGLTSVGVVVVDRYLTLGSWDHVTSIIRRMRSPQKQVNPELAELVQKHPDASMLMAVPEGFYENYQKLIQKSGAGPGMMFDMIMNQLKTAEIDVGDPELSSQMKDSLQKLVSAVKTLYGEYQKIGQSAVMTGKHEGNFYVIDSSQKMTK